MPLSPENCSWKKLGKKVVYIRLTGTKGSGRWKQLPAFGPWSHSFKFSLANNFWFTPTSWSSFLSRAIHIVEWALSNHLILAIGQLLIFALSSLPFVGCKRNLLAFVRRDTTTLRKGNLNNFVMVSIILESLYLENWMFCHWLVKFDHYPLFAVHLLTAHIWHGACKAFSRPWNHNRTHAVALSHAKFSFQKHQACFMKRCSQWYNQCKFYQKVMTCQNLIPFFSFPFYMAWTKICIYNETDFIVNISSQINPSSGPFASHSGRCPWVYKLTMLKIPCHCVQKVDLCTLR